MYDMHWSSKLGFLKYRFQSVLIYLVVLKLRWSWVILQILENRQGRPLQTVVWILTSVCRRLMEEIFRYFNTCSSDFIFGLTDDSRHSIATSKPPAQVIERLNTPSINEYWMDTINFFQEYIAYRPWFINILEKFQIMWDPHLGEINTATHRVMLSSLEARAIHVVPYCTGSKAQEAGKEKNYKI